MDILPSSQKSKHSHKNYENRLKSTDKTGYSNHLVELFLHKLVNTFSKPYNHNDLRLKEFSVLWNHKRFEGGDFHHYSEENRVKNNFYRKFFWKKMRFETWEMRPAQKLLYMIRVFTKKNFLKNCNCFMISL